MLHLTFVLIVAALAVYGAHLFYQWAIASSRRTAGTLAAAGVALSMVMPDAVSHASSTIDFNLDPFFDSLNTYLPIFIGLFAVIGGIAGAMALARYVIGAVVKAFSGSGSI
jgi:hypothetical protein